MRYTLRRTADELLVYALHKEIFPRDHWDPPEAMWVASDEDGDPVGFCMARKLKDEDAVFLSRAGVIEAARGAGLQRRMIRVRVRWARSIGVSQAITYTLFDNWPSIRNLLACGFRFYKPDWRYAGNVHYFTLDLTGDEAQRSIRAAA